MLHIEGFCVDCEDYHRVSEDGKSCTHKCPTNREKVSILGICEVCPDYTHPHFNNRECSAGKCTDT